MYPLRRELVRKKLFRNFEKNPSAPPKSSHLLSRPPSHTLKHMDMDLLCGLEQASVFLRAEVKASGCPPLSADSRKELPVLGFQLLVTNPSLSVSCSVFIKLNLNRQKQQQKHPDIKQFFFVPCRKFLVMECWHCPCS
jgi:hypothetical protein